MTTSPIPPFVIDYAGELRDLRERHRETLDALAQSQERCRELEAAQRWIPCSEREPEEDGRYAILYATRDRPDRLRQFTGDYLVNGPGSGWGSIVDNDVVTHWMALPPAPMLRGGK